MTNHISGRKKTTAPLNMHLNKSFWYMNDQIFHELILQLKLQTFECVFVMNK
jgi:hypothetical protein